MAANSGQWLLHGWFWFTVLSPRWHWITQANDRLEVPRLPVRKHGVPLNPTVWAKSVVIRISYARVSKIIKTSSLSYRTAVVCHPIFSLVWIASRHSRVIEAARLFGCSSYFEIIKLKMDENEKRCWVVDEWRFRTTRALRRSWLILCQPKTAWKLGIRGNKFSSVLKFNSNCATFGKN